MPVLGDSTVTSYINDDILTDIGTLFTTITNWMTGNPILSLFFTLSLVAVACGIFKGVRRILRG